MSTTTRRLVGLAAIAFAAQASAQVTFYEKEGFRGPTFQANGKVWNFERFGFNDRASSAVVDHGRWEVCEDAGFKGRCVVLRRGNYDSLRAMGLNNQISSVRPVDGNYRSAYRAEEPVPAPVPAYEWRRRPNERLTEVPVTSVRAVMGSAEQRCWIEHQPVGQTQIGGHDVNVPGAVVGGVLGGILGHQIGGGVGNTLATVGGVAGGAAVGSHVGNQVAGTRDVRRCENVAGQTPQYYDVTYDWRGTQHHVQMTAPPGRTILVNGNGEPRT